MPKKKIKKQLKTQLLKKADKVYSEYRRKEIGKCEHCGKKDGLQLAHIISRSCRKLRYSDENTLILCAGCHFNFHRKPLHFVAFVDKIKGAGSGKKLIRESNELKPMGKDFYEYIIKKYQILLQELNQE